MTIQLYQINNLGELVLLNGSRAKPCGVYLGGSTALKHQKCPNHANWYTNSNTVDVLCFRRSRSNRFSFQWGQLFIFTSHFSFEQFASCFGFGLGGGGGGARRPCITVQLPAVSTPIGQSSGQCASNQTIAAWLTTHFWQHQGWRSSIQLNLSWWTAKKKEKNMFIASWRELWNAFPKWKLAKR